jgi:hypothetical protein
MKYIFKPRRLNKRVKKLRPVLKERLRKRRLLQGKEPLFSVEDVRLMRIELLISQFDKKHLK